MPKTKSSSVLAGAVGAPTMTRSKLGLVALATAGALTLGAPGAFAVTTTDPALLFITSSPGVFCGSGGACVVGNEVNPLTSSTLYVNFNSNSGATTGNPVLLFVGVPTGGTIPTISTTISHDGTAIGGTANFQSATPGFNTTNAYEFVGLNDGVSSESFVNWQSATQAATGTSTGPSSYTIAEYALNPTTAFTAGDELDVTFTGLANGDMVVAYACATGVPVTACTPPGNIYDTPFTQAGVVDLTTSTTTTTRPVPEPASLGLLGAALAGLGLAGRRRRRI